jgi:hypothetical protein
MDFTHSKTELGRLNHFKQAAPSPAVALGPEMISFFKQSVEKRQTKLGKVAVCWGTLVPEALNEHCALEGFYRGTLTVLVDSSTHLYELKQLMLAGLEQQIQIACKSAGLRKVVLKAGRWYEGEGKPRFER